MQDWFSANAPTSPKPQPAEQDWFAQPKPKTPVQTTPSPEPEGGSLGRFVEGALGTIDPRPLLKMYAQQPTPTAFAGNLVMGILGSQWDQLKKAKEEYDKGNKSEAFGHALAGITPVIGPAAAHAGERIGSGDVAGGLGESAMLLAPSAIAAKSKIGPLNRPGPNPVSADAIAFGRQRGIPIDAATATQSPSIAGMQKMASANPGGAGIAERFRRGQEEALASTGQDLAAQTAKAPQTAESAGQGIVSSIEKRITDEHARANTAYTRLRELEQQAPREVVSTKPDGSRLRSYQLAVDMAPVKSGLQDVYQRLMRERELTGTLNGPKARAAMALDTLMQAPESAQLSVVDGALSDLKALARGADMPELRNTTQSTAAQAVKALDAAVRKRATEAGPEVLKALEDGRSATLAKYVAADVRDSLLTGTQGEPVKVFNRLTGREDTAVNLLRSVQKEAPNALPDVGRAVLDDLMGTATQGGGFSKGATIQNKWRKLGPETKNLLFPDAKYRKSLDNFFHLAEMIERNPNPSGTASTMSAARAAYMIPAWAQAKLMYSPAGVTLLTRGLMLKSQSAAGASLIAQMMRRATEERATALNPALSARSEDR